MPQLYIHTTTTLNLDLPFWTILQQACRLDWQNMIVLVPNATIKSRVYHELAKLECEAGMYPLVFTLDEMLFRTEDAYPNSTPALEHAVVDDTLEEFSAKTPLDPFYKTKGFQQQFLDFINHYDTPLYNWNQSERSDAYHLKILLELFCERCDASGIKNRNAIFTLAYQQNFSKQRLFFKGKYVYCVGFYSILESEKRLFTAILPYTKTVFALITTPPLYNTTHPFLQFLKGFAFETHSLLSFDNLPQHPILLTGTIFKSIAEECLAITQKIQSLSNKSIGVIVPNKHYERLLILALDDAGVAHHSPRTFDVIDSPFYSFLLSTFSLLATPDRSYVLQFFSNPFVRDVCISKSVTYTVNPSLIHILSLQDGASDTSFWTDACATLLNDMTHVSENPGWDTTVISEHQQIFNTIFEHVNQLNTAADFPTYKACWRAFFKTLSISKHITHYPYPPLRDKSLIAYTAFFTLMESYFSYAKPKSFNAGDFSEGFFRFLHHSSLPYPEHNLEGVHLLPLNAGWDYTPEILFIPGFCNSSWPGAFKQSLIKNNLYSEHISKAQLQLFLLLSSGSDIYLSHCTEASTLALHLEYAKLFTFQWTPYSPPTETNAHSGTPLPMQTDPFFTDPTREAWNARFLNKHLSASQLELYQSCPFRYFMRYVLKTQPFEELKEDIDAAVWGSLVHLILFHLLDAPPEQALDLALSLFQKEAKNTLYWDLKKELLFGKEGKKGLIQTWQDLREKNAAELKPLHKEWPFTLAGTPPIKGVIDAVMSDSKDGWAILWDYKTGKKTPTSPAVFRYESLQLSLYHLALLQALPQLTIAGAVIVHLNHPDTANYKVLYATPEADKALFPASRSLKRCDDLFIPNLKTHLNALRHAISGGNFSELKTDHLPLVLDRKTACTSCDYRLTCRFPSRFDGGFL